MKACVAVILLAVVALGAACGKGKGGHKKVCNGEEGNMGAFMTDAEGCKEHFQNKGEGKQGKMQAFGKFMVCMWDKQGIIEGDSINKEKFTVSCKNLFPNNGQNLADTISKKCFNDVHGLNKDDLTTFKELFICVFKTWGEVCPDAKGRKQNADEE